MRILLFVLSMFFSLLAVSQSAQYPQYYFRNPLNIPMSLSGNFGELRSNHYHMGIDIRTNQRENLPVYASADGYISRIKIEPGGFGRALYITHPNGYTTLYAHLNAFAPKIEAYLKEQQYAQESWRIQLELPEYLFPVKKGSFIANSGNTGGSQAPHLHFEIRRTEDDVNVNPLLFGFPVPDQVRPRLLRLGIYDRTRSIYEQSPKIVALKAASSGSYITTPSLIRLSYPMISFSTTAFDSHNNSSNLNGIYRATLYVDDAERQSFEMDRISYLNTRYLNAHIDYRYRLLSNTWLQHLTELPGYLNSIYQGDEGNGVIDISDGEVHSVELEVADTEGNKSTLRTSVQYDGRPAGPAPINGQLFYPLMMNGFESESCEFFIGENCLYDSVHIPYSHRPSADPDVISEIHTIGARHIPLHQAFLIRIRPDPTFREEDRDRTVMLWSAGSKKAVQKVEWQQEWASARFRDFGDFQLVQDTTAPVIKMSFASGADLSRSGRIVFSVNDNLPGIKNVRAELDGKWLMFTNDKGRNFIYAFDEKCGKGQHRLVVTAVDEAGNRVRQSWDFSR